MKCHATRATGRPLRLLQGTTGRTRRHRIAATGLLLPTMAAIALILRRLRTGTAPLPSRRTTIAAVTQHRRTVATGLPLPTMEAIALILRRLRAETAPIPSLRTTIIAATRRRGRTVRRRRERTLLRAPILRRPTTAIAAATPRLVLTPRRLTPHLAAVTRHPVARVVAVTRRPAVQVAGAVTKVGEAAVTAVEAAEVAVHTRAATAAAAMVVVLLTDTAKITLSIVSFRPALQARAGLFVDECMKRGVSL